MTAPASKPGLPRPARLSFLNVPLLIGLIYWAISLLAVPFSGPTLNDTLAEYSRLTGVPLVQFTPEQLSGLLWGTFFITALLVWWLATTRQAVLDGKRWGRVSSIVLAVLSLLVFPFGTVLGIVMLIGAFDRDVRAFLRR
ncbi:hypothetical protein [Deinococcus petrolearius]|uniref:DUF4234 domain-containing protein n=1 Tax=Deinococcus petrolearius TaxID=1751295 RepID=A0ABW1DP46_9DEIO